MMSGSVHRSKRLEGSMASAAPSAAVHAVILASEVYNFPVRFASTGACSAAWDCMESSGACGRLTPYTHLYIIILYVI